MWISTSELRRGAFGKLGAPFYSPVRAHLLTTAPNGAAVVLPAATVRSTRWMRLLRQPPDNATTLRSCCHCPRSWRLLRTISANRLRKPATGSFAAAMGVFLVGTHPFSFCEKETKTRGR